MHQRHATADEIVTGVIKVVAVEIVNGLRQCTGTDERIHHFIFEEETRAGHGLIGIVTPHHAFAGFMIVRLTNAGKQHQTHVVHLVSRNHHDIRRLLPHHAVAADEGHAGGGFAVGGFIDAQDFGFRDHREVRALHDRRQNAGIRAALRPVTAAEELAVAAVGARRHIHSQRVGIRAGSVARRYGKRVIAHLTSGFIENHRQLGALERRQRIIAAARAFEHVTAFDLLPFDIARFTGCPGVAFKFVVERFDVVIGNAPVLHLHSVEEFLFAVALHRLAVALEIVRQKTPGHAVPVGARAADVHAELIGVEFAQRQRLLDRIVTKRQGFHRRRLHDRAAADETQLVSINGGREIITGVSPRATLNRHDIQPRQRQLIRHQRSGPSEADDHCIDLLTFIAHLSCAPEDLKMPVPFTDGFL